MQIDAVGTVRKRLNAVTQLPFFGVIDFVDKGIAKAAHLHCADVTHVEIGVQGGGGFELAMGFQFDFTGFTQLKAGVQGEIMRPEGTSFIVSLQLKGQHGAVVVFVMRFQGPLLVTGKTVRRQTRLCGRAEPRPADRYAAANRRPFFERGRIAQPQSLCFTFGFPGEQVGAVQRHGGLNAWMVNDDNVSTVNLAAGEHRGKLFDYRKCKNFINH